MDEILARAILYVMELCWSDVQCANRYTNKIRNFPYKQKYCEPTIFCCGYGAMPKYGRQKYERQKITLNHDCGCFADRA